MERIKLLDYQINDIRNRLDHTYNTVENMILSKYLVHSIEELNATDYDAIMNDIMKFTNHIRIWKGLGK